MNAEIVAIGSELLLGQIVNSNASHISRELSYLGVDVYHHVAVGDNPDRLYDVLKQAASRSDFVICTGGLGPTKDDLTKEVLADLAGRRLVYDEQTEQQIIDYYKKWNRVMPGNNRKQAMIIEGSEVLPNYHGLSCGMVVPLEQTKIMLLPGPPNELIPMFRDYALPYIKSMLNVTEEIESRVLRFFDIGESMLAEKLDDLFEAQTNPTMAPLASMGEVMLRLTVKGEDHGKNQAALDRLQNAILERIGDYFIGIGETPLVQMVTELLHDQKKTVTAAESLTGGLFSSALTSVKGVSSVFPGSIVCYSNQVKEMVLSVPRELIQSEGVVSEACARKLAENSRKLLNTDIAISFTGVAGPDELEGHPPGTVFISLTDGKREEVHRLQLAGSRENIQDRTVKYGCFYLRNFLLNE